MNKLFFLACLALLVSSCGESFEEGLVGTWLLETAEISGCPDETDNFPFTMATADGCITGLCETVVVSEGGTYTVTITDGGGTETQSGTYTVADDKATFCSDGDCFTPDIDGDVLTLTQMEDGCTFSRTYKKQ